MLLVGGNFFANDDRSRVDPWANGMEIFDLTALNWTQGVYDHSAEPYKRAEPVQELYNQKYIALNLVISLLNAVKVLLSMG